jgi:uncharacterized glyoxalase superfamily protein PhnB
MTPVLRYRNPGAAARWLCEAFGFRERASAQESDQHVKYILLGLGDSSVLVRPVSSSVFDDLMVQPGAVGGGNTHVLYLPVGDAERHCAHAKSAGAKIELEPQDDGLGGRFYTCRDPEGHLWSFGTKRYDLSEKPSNGPNVGRGAGSSTVHLPGPPSPTRGDLPGNGHGGLRRRSLAAVTVLVALAAGWMLYQTYGNGAFETGTAMTTGTVEKSDAANEQLALEMSRRLAAETASSDAASKFGEEKSRRLAAEAAAAEATSKFGEEKSRRLAAEAAAADAQAKLGQESTRAAEARQTLERLDGEWARERRQAQEALALSEQRLVARAAETARDKEDAAKALAALEQRLADVTAASERARREVEATASQAASEKTQQAAAAISASVEAASAKTELAQLEAAMAKQGEELEAAYTTLKAIRGELEGLRASQQAAKREPPGEPQHGLAAAEPAAAPLASPPPARPGTPCAQAIQGKVRLTPNGSRAWPEGNLARLCHGAETSLEPARCYDELMRGKISWGTGSTWTPPHALLLCAGTRNARQTLDCFATSIANNETWAAAINNCKLSKQ